MATKEQNITISAPNLAIAEFKIEGTAPYVQLRFSEKALNQMKEKMEAGSVAKKGKKRAPRDFDDDYKQAFRKPSKGGYGIPASAFRNAMISACKIVGFHMTKAKLAVFIVADDFDLSDGVPLVKLEGKPEKVEHYVRNETGVVDIRVRAMWRSWKAKVKVQYDADMFSLEDISNLMLRVGMQVGIGEGRPDGKKSAGMGWGTFQIIKK